MSFLVIAFVVAWADGRQMANILRIPTILPHLHGSVPVSLMQDFGSTLESSLLLLKKGQFSLQLSQVIVELH